MKPSESFSDRMARQSDDAYEAKYGVRPNGTAHVDPPAVFELPSRDQLAETAYEAEKKHDFGQAWTEEWHDESPDYQATYYAIADALIDLLKGSHETPQAH